MWRNADVLDFVGWLREHNDEQSYADRKAGFYGLDLYSLHASIEAVLAYLGKVDPEAAKRARHHYSCFEHFGKKIETYGYATGFGLAPTCEDAVVRNWSRCGARRWIISSATARWRRTPISARNKMRAWSRTRKNITARCFGAKSLPGTCVTTI